jgi:hypothetical protein
MKQFLLSLPFFLLVFLPTKLRAQWLLDVEGGAAWEGLYNRVQIPGTTGTRFDLTTDFNRGSTPYFRLRAGYTFADRHTISVLYAPLSFRSSGTPQQALRFAGTTFAPGAELERLYQFNSYRLTYRFDFLRRERLRIGAGLTAKIRDAIIRLESPTEAAEKTDVGFVPIIHIYLAWQMAPRLGLLVEGDALAAPQGRAADVFAGLTYALRPDRLSLKAGYRLLEGGADNEVVYNFSWINYAAGGVIFRF